MQIKTKRKGAKTVESNGFKCAILPRILSDKIDTTTTTTTTTTLHADKI